MLFHCVSSISIVFHLEVLGPTKEKTQAKAEFAADFDISWMPSVSDGGQLRPFWDPIRRFGETGMVWQCALALMGFLMFLNPACPWIV